MSCTLSQGVAFWEHSYSHARNGATATATTGAGIAKYVLSHRQEQRWLSVGSSNGTTESVTITLAAARDIDVISVGRHNITDITIEYWDGTAWQALTLETVNVTGGKTSHVDLASTINTDKIRVSGSNTTTGGEKFIERVIASKKIGQLSYHPANITGAVDYNEIVAKNIAGRSLIEKGVGVQSLRIGYQFLHTQADLDLVRLIGASDGALVWLCGGIKQDNFAVMQREWEYDGIYYMGAVGNVSTSYANGAFFVGASGGLSLVELA